MTILRDMKRKVNDNMESNVENVEYNVKKSITAQKEYCERENLPYFAPLDGRCWRCGYNIYQKMGHQSSYNGKSFYTGIPTEKAGTFLITGCPHCNKSFCD